jgi:hypothetical protein
MSDAWSAVARSAFVVDRTCLVGAIKTNPNARCLVRYCDLSGRRKTQVICGKGGPVNSFIATQCASAWETSLTVNSARAVGGVGFVDSTALRSLDLDSSLRI